MVSAQGQRVFWPMQTFSCRRERAAGWQAGLPTFRRVVRRSRRLFIPTLAGLQSLDDQWPVLEDVAESIAELKENHAKAYADLGGGSMPTTLGMWKLWNEPTINATL